jgi:hypothetical protein
MDDDYDPDPHRSYVDVDDDADALVESDVPSEHSVGWTMSLPEGGP